VEPGIARLASESLPGTGNSPIITLIKKKINFTHMSGNSEWSSCKVIYEEGLPNNTYMRNCANISPYMRIEEAVSHI
jgi:hypothetical protein